MRVQLDWLFTCTMNRTFFKSNEKSRFKRFLSYSLLSLTIGCQAWSSFDIVQRLSNSRLPIADESQQYQPSCFYHHNICVRHVVTCYIRSIISCRHSSTELLSLISIRLIMCLLQNILIKYFVKPLESTESVVRKN